MADQPDPGDTPPPPSRSKSGRKQPGGAPTPHDSVSLGPDAEEAYVTTAEMLRAEGEACRDLDTLNSWFRRSLKVDKASDLFEE
jgi:hypothetical protein